MEFADAARVGGVADSQSGCVTLFPVEVPLYRLGVAVMGMNNVSLSSCSPVTRKEQVDNVRSGFKPMLLGTANVRKIDIVRATIVAGKCPMNGCDHTVPLRTEVGVMAKGTNPGWALGRSHQVLSGSPQFKKETLRYREHP